MINLDSITNENNKKRNEKWPYIPDDPYRVLIIGGSGSGKTNTSLNLINEQDYHDVIDKIYLYAKDLSEPKYEYLIKKHEDAGIKHDMIADIMTNKRFQAIIKDLFIRCRKSNIPLIFITQYYFSVLKDVRLNSTHYLIMKINNRITKHCN